MSEGSPSPSAQDAAKAGNTTGGPSGAAPKKPAPEGNPAFRAMGLPRLRLPSRNWMIFLSVTGGIASAIMYDKWQTKRIKEKWCNLVSHIADEPLSTKQMPRKLTIYLSAPPGDGLRVAREHFHDYIKPILVAGAMDWDVVEGRKEGDVRYKTAERIRRKRKRAGEGEALPQDEMDSQYSLEAMREKSATSEYTGVAGDLIVGRHTWKEYVRGLHEGWLGPPDAPPEPVLETSSEIEPATHVPGQPSLGDVAVKAAADVVTANTPAQIPTSEEQSSESKESEEKSEETSKEEEKKEEEKPKRRNPLPLITPLEYDQASLSPSAPEIIGPSIAIRFPHILGFMNTRIRTYRFFTRRYLADEIGRDVASAVLATYRPYSTVSAPATDGSPDPEKIVPEQMQVLAHEERNWLKAVWQPRKELEEALLNEDVVLDERIFSRMRAFQLTSEDEARAKRIAEGVEKIGKQGEES